MNCFTFAFEGRRYAATSGRLFIGLLILLGQPTVFLNPVRLLQDGRGAAMRGLEFAPRSYLATVSRVASGG